ncbi:MAG: hypothetical protein JW797_08290 [Bradymonadales bacterium]|nr:hypothetical protein [Bradymonadales bacterium]
MASAHGPTRAQQTNPVGPDHTHPSSEGGSIPPTWPEDLNLVGWRHQAGSAAEVTGIKPTPLEEPLPIAPFDPDDRLVEATGMDGRPRMALYPYPSTALVLGRGSRVEREIHSQACQRDGIPLLRRTGGGCAVLLDPGNAVLSVAVATQKLGSLRRQFDTISDWLLDGLRGIGVRDLGRNGTSDLTLADRKISGSCMARSRDLLYYSATLLVDPRFDLMERYLAHPPREPDYRRRRSHRDFVGRLLGQAGIDSVATLCTALRAHLDLATLVHRLDI